MDKPVIVYDTEVYPNMFMFKGRVLHNRNLITIRDDDQNAAAQLRETLAAPCTFVSFNGIKFDVPVMSAFLAGKSTEEVKRIANAIIEQELQPWDVERRFGFKCIGFDHIDLIEVAPSFVGLKSYGARMHMPWLKELPYPHDTVLTEEQKDHVGRYCENDLDTTEELFKRLEDQLLLRIEMSKMYGTDLRSKSATQMAETSFIQKLGMKRRLASVPYHINYQVPGYIHFETPHLQELLGRIGSHDYAMNLKTGHVILPDFLVEKVKLNSGTYQLGVGGIHSTHDKKVCHVATEDWVVMDIDAASYYPSIWVKWGIKLENTDRALTEEYSTVYYRRLDAKKTGDERLAENLKVPINGSFGKLLSRYSPLYNPELGLFITLTGQLTLLMLIEWLEKVGAVALSANTDGIAMAYPKSLGKTVENVVSEFSELSQYEFEYTPYRALAMKDVNNYLAVKTDRKIKSKGIYAPPDLRKNPTASICAKAVGLWLAHGTPFEETVRDGTLEEFISARNVTGGGVQGTEYLGKVVRWYNSTDESLPPLTYQNNGNKVPKTDGVRACMLIDKNAPLPADLDYNWYVKEAIRIAVDLGCRDYLTDEQIALVTPPPKVRKPRKTKS